MGDGKPIEQAVAFQVEPSKDRELERQLTETKSELEQKHPEWTVYNSSEDIFRVQNENGQYNFFNPGNSEQPLRQEWLKGAGDFKIIDGKKVALVWVDYNDGAYSGEELKRMKPNGTFVEKESDVTLKYITEKLEPKKKKTEPEVVSDYFKSIQDEYRNRLGRGDLKFPVFPDYMTSEILDNAVKYGFEAHVSPNLSEHINKEKFNSMSVDKFADYMKSEFPWVCHDEWFWTEVKDGKIEFPDFSGCWYLVETINDSANPYPLDITKMLGLRDRFDLTWDNVKSVIDRKNKNILRKLKLLDKGKLVILDAIGLDLYSTLKGPFGTMLDWTETRYASFVSDEKSGHLIFGSSYGNTGFSGFGWRNTEYSNANLGFHLAVAL
jgi:hypothetical protein